MRAWAVGGLAIVACATACGRLGFESANRSADAATDATEPTDAPTAAPPCLGTAHLLTENFDDGVANTSLWSPYANAGTSFAENSGSLRITLSANNPGKWAGYESANTYDLRGDRFFAEVVSVPGPAVEVMVGVRVGSDYASLEFNVDTLVAVKTIGGTWSGLASVLYNPAQHRYWQVRDRAGLLSWETSPDAIAWTVLHAEAPPFPLAAATLVVSSGTEIAAGSPQQVRFDNINGGGAPPDCPL